jgi:hypothetical protein
VLDGSACREGPNFGKPASQKEIDETARRLGLRIPLAWQKVLRLGRPIVGRELGYRMVEIFSEWLGGIKGKDLPTLGFDLRVNSFASINVFTIFMNGHERNGSRRRCHKQE